MKLAAAMRVGEGESYSDVAQRAARLGYQGVSIGFDHRWTETDLVGIRWAFDEQGVDIVELRCYCNFVTPRDDEARRNVERLQYALRAGGLLNCDHAVTYAGSRHPDPEQHFAPHPDNWSDATWDLLVKRAWSLLDGVDDVGVRLCFAPCRTTTLNTLDSLAELVADVATVRVRVALDPAALLTPEAAAHPGQALAEIFARLSDAIAVAHATDVALIEAGPEPQTTPARLGEGILDYATYLKLLDALELDTPLVVTYQGTDAGYERALSTLREAAARPT